jgi:hypothetical protein
MLRSEDIQLPNSWGTTLQSAPADPNPWPVRWVVAAAAMIACFCAPVLADDQPVTPPIADSVRQASALGPDQIQQIGGTVHQLAQALADGSNPSAQSDARRSLVAAVSDTAGAPCSPVYLDTLAKSVNAELLAVVSAPEANIRAKIQAGLVAQEVATKSSQNTDMAPLVAKLLSDPSPPVALVGLKAVGGLLPAMLNQNPLTKSDEHLLVQILAAVEEHGQPPLAADITRDAYDALSEPVFSAGGVNPGRVHDVILPLVIKLEQSRIKQYGAVPPPQGPQGDATGLVILLAHDTWTNMNPAEQKTVLKIASDLIAGTAKVAQTLKGERTPEYDPGPFLEALQTDAQELKFISAPGNGWAPSDEVYAAATALGHLGPGSAAAAIGAAADTTVKAIDDLAAGL